MTFDHPNSGDGRGITISCDDCSMQSTSACRDCVVTYLLSDAGEAVRGAPPGELLELDRDQVRVVRLLGAAGLVPGLKYRVAG